MIITSLIMAGGKGERFWPKSRTNLPKQFLNISGNKSMIQQTVERLERLMEIDQVFIVTNESYAELIRVQVPHLPEENIIIEPVGKNTAPCVGLAAIQIERKYPDSTMVVLPSDHIIKDEEEFLRTLRAAIEVASRDTNIVTLGINPLYPETGYGYIESTNHTVQINGLEVHLVSRFVEKPNLETAEKYIQQGGFYWNSGIFVWKTTTVLQKIKEFLPVVYDILSTIRTALDGPDKEQTIKSEFIKMPDESIDYGIMEKSDHIYVIPCKLGWDDVGSWTALDRINDRDENGNVIIGHTLNMDTKRCIIESNNGKLIATLGIEDLIVVDTEDVTLICSKDKAQEVKRLLKELRSQHLVQYL
ncbi:mannose-1-phosphate guanylyltransferase [Cohnella thailandensis]|uniref:mannose-1-phosphate guanylyltransferase n=1 Tax=Cohnella thailandensis TaxID=557557 RepID=A0A841T621_9BACL|nr:mannose-1-phosphate guanylyltransferase [Cohnella thailandensis]MBB6638135.1 mannose-1-phosphate guanylyltransferase [Cohnella thailandensis]MBP1971938.1 mannose-1-phosphate guanylyltransferase [Cohnella thailandensis]